jgi:hypothetical protein
VKGHDQPEEDAEKQQHEHAAPGHRRAVNANASPHASSRLPLSPYASRRHLPSFSRSSGVPQRRQKLRHSPSEGSKNARLRDRRCRMIQHKKKMALLQSGVGLAFAA